MCIRDRFYTRQDTSRWFAFALRGGTVVSISDGPGGNLTRADSVAAPHASHYATTSYAYEVLLYDPLYVTPLYSQFFVFN